MTRQLVDVSFKVRIVYTILPWIHDVGLEIATRTVSRWYQSHEAGNVSVNSLYTTSENIEFNYSVSTESSTEFQRLRIESRNVAFSYIYFMRNRNRTLHSKLSTHL